MPAKGTFTHVAVMGDLIASEGAANISKLHAIFNHGVQSLNQRRRKALASPLTITLGDEFQGLAKRLVSGLSIIRELGWTLRADGVRCRFVLGLVRIDTPVNSRRAWNMLGPGLARAREALADKRDPNAYRFSLPKDADVEPLLCALGASASEIEASWTDRQFEIVRASLEGETLDADLAAKLGIGVRSLYKIRRAARYDLYRRQWSAIEGALAELDARYGLA